MRTVGQGTYMLPRTCGCKFVRLEGLIVVDTGTAVVVIVVCAANQPVVDEASTYTC
jgi:hypothetical protein